MTDKEKKRNLDPERTEQNVENKTPVTRKFNAGGNESDYDGGHPEDSRPKRDDHLKNGEGYARRQHGKDEIEDRS
ncbi:hypothetical protein DHX103_04970 [Planococcus sp. X10-3]|uniref:hypothetical protein n=1 Tax=Planococcus sp. X10-3 TaxID=3061240 RepID=UPI003BB0C9CC